MRKWPAQSSAPRSDADTHRMRGAYGIRIRTQLYLQCYCACRRHQGCHCRETETSVRLRFWAALGQAGACSYPITWGARRKAQWLVENLKAEHLRGVAQFANQRGGSSSEALRVQSSRLAISTEEARVRPEGERIFQPLDLANWRDRPHMRRGSTNQCNPRRRQGGDLLCSRLP